MDLHSKMKFQPQYIKKTDEINKKKIKFALFFQLLGLININY